MKSLWQKLFVGLVFSVLFAPRCFAVEDFIAPTKISFQVKPGETLSYDLIYKSGIGGVYDLSTRVFQYTEGGAKSFLDVVPAYVSYSETVYEFQPGDEKKIPIQLNIPVEMEEQDVYLSHFMRRRSQEQQTFELGSLMFLRVGEVANLEGTVSNLQYVDSPETSEDGSDGFQSVSFDFENEAGRYFSLSPVVEIFDEQGKNLVSLKNPSSVVFPEFKKSVSIFNFSDSDIAQADSDRAVLKVYAEGEKLLHEEELRFPQGKVFLRQERLSSPFDSINIRKGFLYNPIFQISAIVIGLTLIGVSFFINRK